MVVQIKHKFHSLKLDGPDATQVRPVDWNADHDILGSGFMVTGQIIDFVGHTVPSDFVEAYGQSLSSTTYVKLFNALVKQATVTFTLGSPGTVNWTNHGLPINSKIRFRTGGSLPAGISENVDYFITTTAYSVSSFLISATVGGSAIDFSGTPGGTQTGIHAPFGVSNDLTTFSVPDLRGRVVAGLDTMGGAASGRLTGIAGSVNGGVLGAAGGAEGAVLAVADLPAHSHTVDPASAPVAITVDSAGAHTHTVSGTISEAPDHSHGLTGGSISAAGGHAHNVSGGTSTDTPDHAHAQAGRQYGATYGGAGAHTHPIYDAYSAFIEQSDAQFPTSGGRKAVQPSDAGGGTNQYFAAQPAGAHEHSVYVDIGGYTAGASARHAHTFNVNSNAVADHTHTFSVGTIAAGGAHTHTFTSGTAASGGAHTHTASGTVDIAPFASGNAGGGAAHNNVQPTLIVRKLIFVG